MPPLFEFILLHNIQFGSDIFSSTYAYSTRSKSPNIRGYGTRSRSRSCDSDREFKEGEFFCCKIHVKKL